MRKDHYSRRDFIKQSVVAGVAAPFAGKSLFTEKREKKAKSALMVWGGWDGHRPKQSVELFAPFLEENGFDVEISNTLDSYLDEENMNSKDLIVQIFTMSTEEEESKKVRGLRQAVRNGVGLAGWHGGLGDAFRRIPEYQFMIGGQWVSHPGGQVDYEVNIVDSDDPIIKGLTDFKVRSEQYYMHVDPLNEVLATTTFNGEHASWIDGAVMPVAWKKVYGKGRVFFSSLGHNPSVYDIPQAKRMMERGMLWASR